MQVFKNKIDKEIYYFIAFVYIVLFSGWYFTRNSQHESLFIPILIVTSTVFFVTKFLFKKYELDTNLLNIKSLFKSTLINIHYIKSIKRKTLIGVRNRNNATSKDLLEINYGFSEIIYISPVNQRAFVDAILLVNQNVEVQIDNVEVEIKLLRSRMIILSLFSIFIIYILLTLIIPMFLASESDLITDKGDVAYAFGNTYVTTGKHPTVDSCVDIRFVNGLHQVRITSNYHEHWAALLDSNINGTAIQIKVYPWRALDYLVYNPEKITIDNRVVIPFKAHSFQKGIFVLIFTALPALLIFSVFKASKLYRKYLLSSDQQIRQESIWKYIKRWLVD